MPYIGTYYERLNYLEEEEERLYHYKIDGIRQNKRFKRESWFPYDKCTVIPD
jgi:hypothetical protein